MSVSEVAQSLVSLCNEGRFVEAYDALFASNARSVESNGEAVEGLEALHAKSKEWGEAHEIRSFAVKGPFVGVDTFAAHFQMEIVMKASGTPMTFEEIALYKVEEGKIVEERFLYGV